MSQTSHVGAIISMGTAYKAAVGETVARTERREERNIGGGKRIVIQGRAEAPARGPVRRSRDLNVKRTRVTGDQAASELTSFR